MSKTKWVEDQIPKHLSARVQSIMRNHLLKEYHKKENSALTTKEEK